MAQGLKAGTLLDHGMYRVERILGSGGFGITYLVTDLGLDKLRAMKEFFPKDYCDRNETTSHVTLGTSNTAEFVDKLKKKFIKEARNIANLDQHSGIITIHRVFEENNTAYYVMDYIDGENLSTMVKKEGPLPIERAVKYITQVGEALEYVHQHHINHLDVKPANIMVRRKDDIPILIDFGISKRYDDSGEQTSTSPIGVSHGYTPIEQYLQGGVSEFSPQTDVYSLAATLYFLLEGVNPPSAFDLYDQPLSFRIVASLSVILAIKKAMSYGRKERFENIRLFISSISLKSSCDQNYNIIDVSKSLDIKGEPEEPKSKKSPPKLSKGLKKREDKPKQKNNKKSDEKIGEIINGIKVTWNSKISIKQKETIKNIINNMVYVLQDDIATTLDSNNNQINKKVDNSFFICKFVVTQEEWEAIMFKYPKKYTPERLPVVSISLKEIEKFLNKLKGFTGIKFRLPEEREWEYAARGGQYTKGFEYSGSNNLNEVAWYYQNSDQHIHTVGLKKPNELGLYDMTGNIWEWTSKILVDQITINNQNFNTYKYVLRGGSWVSKEDLNNDANRNIVTEGYKNNHVGFRLAI